MLLQDFLTEGRGGPRKLQPHLDAEAACGPHPDGSTNSLCDLDKSLHLWEPGFLTRRYPPSFQKYNNVSSVGGSFTPSPSRMTESPILNGTSREKPTCIPLLLCVGRCRDSYFVSRPCYSRITPNLEERGHLPTELGPLNPL